jgi:hypothetical protein
LLNTLNDISTYSSDAAGIGLSMSNIRSKESRITSSGGYAGGLLKYLKIVNESLRFFNQQGRRPGSAAIYIEPWHKDVMDLLDIKNNTGAEELIANLEYIWRQLGFPPGKRQLSKYGRKISESPYKKNWGSVSAACKAFADYQNNKISWEELLVGINKNDLISEDKRDIPLRLRYEVLKRDNFRCVLCGNSPAKTPDLALHADHIVPFSKGGQTTLENLRTACFDCNIGRSNKD